jgi:signal transduction histidine kinase
LLKEQELKSYSAMLEGQDKERQRIASDLHDRLGGILSTVKAYFQTIDEKIKSLEEKTVVQYEKAAELLNTAVEEVRNISHDLHSGVLKNFGLCAAVSDLKNTIELTGQLKIDLFVSGKKRKLDTNKEIEIYRLVQELFSNTMKHARANKVTLQFTFAENNINVIFEDDGIGFDPRKVTKGIGLKNIEARISKLNGDYSIDSAPGRGTIIILDIPEI